MSQAAFPRFALDHLVITAPDLARGVRWLADALGVEPGPGGSHPRMGTHNRLMRLQDEIYLEVIAPDPAAPPPGRPRWFGLDALAPDATPRLAAWVVRTDDLDAAHRATSRGLGLDLGAIEPMRRGPWSWRITIPAEGEQPWGGLAPALIEWPAGDHPALHMAPSGVRLVDLTLHADRPAPVQDLLDGFGLPTPVAVRPAAEQARGLQARFATPDGLRTLGGGAPTGRP